NVPAGEYQVLERGEGNELLHLRRTPFGAFAEPHRAHLRERTDWLGEPFANRLHAGDEGSRDCAHPRDHHAELALGRLHGAFYRLRAGLLSATTPTCQLHLPAGSFGVSESGLAVLVFARCCGVGELFAMAAADGIPPVGHEYSRTFLIHLLPFLVAVTVAVARHHSATKNHLILDSSFANAGG